VQKRRVGSAGSTGGRGRMRCLLRAAVVMAFPFGDGGRGTNGGRRTVSACPTGLTEESAPNVNNARYSQRL
jgi:hypothetical protein